MPAENITYCEACTRQLTGTENRLCTHCASQYFRCAACNELRPHRDFSRVNADYCRDCRPAPRFSFTPIGDPPYVGWELEVESSEEEYEKAERETLKAFPESFVTINGDGSLSEQGFEIVSRPASLAEHLKACPAFFQAANSGKMGRLTSWSNNTCGLHVHICRRASTEDGPFDADILPTVWELNEHAIALIVCFVNLPRNARFIQTIAGRDANTYTQFKRKRMLTAARKTGDKYEAVNLEHNATLEFRIFKGTLRLNSFLKALEFTIALSEFCKGLYNTRKALSLSMFIKYVGENHSRFPNLDSFISNRWYGRRDRNGLANWRLKNNRKPPLPPVDHGNRSYESAN